MKLFGLSFMALVCAPAISWATATTTTTGSVYTDLEKDCIDVSVSTQEAEIDFYSADCKAFGGFDLKISGGDLRYGPELSYAGQSIELPSPGYFHDMGSTKIEWVYDITRDNEGSGTIRYKALIYRLADQSYDEENPNRTAPTTLFVVRLNAGNSCYIGAAKTNQAARDLANQESATCTNPNP